MTDVVPAAADVAVIGGGIAGASAAFHLAAAGLDTVLLERDGLGAGATSAAIGVLSPPVRQPFHETVRFRGAEAAAELWRFALRSVSLLAETLECEGKSGAAGVDLSGGYVLAEPHTRHDLEGSYVALEAAGLPVSRLSAADVRDLTGGRGFTGGYRIEGLGSLRPGPTVRALAEATGAREGRVLEHTPVQGVRRAGPKFVVLTGSGDLEVRHVVYAIHVDSGRFSDELQRQVVSIRGQALRTTPMAPRFRGAFSTGWKLNVWRQDPDGSLLVSGWRHDAWERSYGESDSRVDARLQGDLQRWFESAFPDLGPLEVERRWSGLFGWTADFLPLVGRLPGRPGELVVTGFSGGGIPFAFGCGALVAGILSGDEPPPAAALFDPARFS